MIYFNIRHYWSDFLCHFQRHIFYSRFFVHTNDSQFNPLWSMKIVLLFFLHRFQNRRLLYMYTNPTEYSNVLISCMMYLFAYIMHDPSHYLLIERYQSLKNWFEDTRCALFAYDVRINKREPTDDGRSMKKILTYIASHIIKYSFITKRRK